MDDHLHGVWLYACGHRSFQCKCLESGEQRHYLTGLCRECRATLQASSRSEPFPKATERTEPFQKAID